MTLKSNLLYAIPGILHGFGDIAHPVPDDLESLWEKKPMWRQVHGIRAAELLYAEQELGEVDAMFSAAPGIPIAVQTADCVPILLARKDGRAAAAVHAGWRGTRARILRELWNRLQASGERASDWVAAIGPAIGPCCYEVSPDLAREFRSEFSSYSADLVTPLENHLDLPAINRAELLALGISEVDLLRACTRCAITPTGEPLYHSFRREKARTRQWSGLVIAPRRVPWAG